MALEEVMRTESNKGAVLSTLAVFAHCQLHCRCQVIIADASRYTAEVVERLHMSKQEAFLVLRRECHDKRSS